MSMMSEFKEFAVKGNAVDMAVGIVVGAAFGAVVSSFVADIIMPPVGMLLGGRFAERVAGPHLQQGFAGMLLLTLAAMWLAALG